MNTTARNLSPLSKSELTRQTIIDAAHDIAGKLGLEALTIGSVADAVGLSKSGVFARVGSREELIMAVLDEASNRTARDVFVPALRESRGLPRLKAMFYNWVRWMVKPSYGCVIMAAAIEYDDRPGPIRDAVREKMKLLRVGIARAVKICVDSGDFAADCDPEQVAFELCALVHMAHHDARLHADGKAVDRAVRGFERLVNQYKAR